MKLRAFDPNRDFEEIRDWITDERTHRMWCGNCFAFPLEKENFREALSGFMERYGDVPFLAVSDEGEAEGFISCAPDPERRECLLKFVVVKPERRGTGAAREMLRLAVEYAFANMDAQVVRLNVFLENHRARKCYENAGFTERCTTLDAFPYGDERWGKCEMIVKKPEKE